MNLTVALTHYEREEMLIESFAAIVDDPRVTEFVIYDDASMDGSFKRLAERFGSLPRIRLHQGTRNINCYAAKAAAVRMSRTPWVVLLDSDNVLSPAYLDALELVGSLDPHTAYLPVFARPEFDYREFAGETVTRRNVWSFMQRPMFATALNTANYVVSRVEYLRAWTSVVDPRTVDSLYMNYRWLSAGNALYFVPGMEYDHRMHDGSHFVRNHTRADELFSRDLQRRLEEMR